MSIPHALRLGARCFFLWWWRCLCGWAAGAGVPPAGTVFGVVFTGFEIGRRSRFQVLLLMTPVTGIRWPFWKRLTATTVLWVNFALTTTVLSPWPRRSFWA